MQVESIYSIDLASMSITYIITTYTKWLDARLAFSGISTIANSTKVLGYMAAVNIISSIWVPNIKTEGVNSFKQLY